MITLNGTLRSSPFKPLMRKTYTSLRNKVFYFDFFKNNVSEVTNYFHHDYI